ncbi:restriction endonuclease subunit S [Flavobacterium caeni]|uniref:Type I restriction enzyme, S subunit n=1 Tax=Flavobacterium caeni TaxID=490189 RepID=A0A1G5B2R9_9FLAO|nr:restriction endonuclease subunit S [Flavobacterium caeni]SCX84360.1 type I restriction enzyme, S subunit [Flavobacterium caeni]
MRQFENGLVPSLRFPGFVGEWKGKSIGTIAELTSSKRVYLSDYVEKGIPFYRGKEITELRQDIEPTEILYISEEAYYGYKESFGVPQLDDILMTAVGTLGNVLRIKNESPFYFKDGNLIWFRKISESSRFLEILLELKKKDIEKTSIGSTQRALTMVELRKLVFKFPFIEEQEKIGTFLSVVDDKLNLLRKKKSLLEQYKKAMMQKIFSQEVRFKDGGKDFGEWEEKTLGEIGKSFIGLTYSPDDVVESNGTLVLRSSNIQDGVLSFKDNVFVTMEISEKNFVKENDILICARNGSRDLIGKSALIKKENEGAAFGAFMTIYRSEFNDFLFHLFKSPIFLKQVNEHLGATINQITTKSLNGFVFPFPTKKEQTKIAQFLTALDDKIAHVSTQIEKMETWKKGLLADMFV